MGDQEGTRRETTMMMICIGMENKRLAAVTKTTDDVETTATAGNEFCFMISCPWFLLCFGHERRGCIDPATVCLCLLLVCGQVKKKRGGNIGPIRQITK